MDHPPTTAMAPLRLAILMTATDHPARRRLAIRTTATDALLRAITRLATTPLLAGVDILLPEDTVLPLVVARGTTTCLPLLVDATMMSRPRPAVATTTFLLRPGAATTTSPLADTKLQEKEQEKKSNAVAKTKSRVRDSPCSPCLAQHKYKRRGESFELDGLSSDFFFRFFLIFLHGALFKAWEEKRCVMSL